MKKCAVDWFKEGYACSTSVLLSQCDRFGMDVECAKKLSSTFGGGMGRLRKTCGALTGAMMVLGLCFGNEDPQDMDTKLFAYDKVQELFRRFEELHGTTDCADLLAKEVTVDQVERREHHQIICETVIADAEFLLLDLLKDGGSDR